MNYIINTMNIINSMSFFFFCCFSPAHFFSRYCASSCFFSIPSCPFHLFLRSLFLDLPTILTLVLKGGDLGKYLPGAVVTVRDSRSSGDPHLPPNTLTPSTPKITTKY